MRYLLLSVLVVCVIGIMIPNAFAVKEIIVQNAPGSSTPGCAPYCFIPNIVKINVNDKITWENNDSAVHTATSGDPVNGPDGAFDSSLIFTGSSYTVTFSSLGTYDYFCMVHPWMEGKVIVNELKYDESASTLPYWGFLIELDKARYSSSDDVNITITVHNSNIDPNATDYIGTDTDSRVSITTSKGTLDFYKLEETGVDTGVFHGSVILNYASTSGTGPWSGKIKTSSECAKWVSNICKVQIPNQDTITIQFTYTYSGKTEKAHASASVEVAPVPTLPAPTPTSTLSQPQPIPPQPLTLDDYKTLQGQTPIPQPPTPPPLQITNWGAMVFWIVIIMVVVIVVVRKLKKRKERSIQYQTTGGSGQQQVYQQAPPKPKRSFRIRKPKPKVQPQGIEDYDLGPLLYCPNVACRSEHLQTKANGQKYCTKCGWNK